MALEAMLESLWYLQAHSSRLLGVSAHQFPIF